MRRSPFIIFSLAHAATAQTRDATVTDTIPATSNFKWSTIGELGMSTTVTMLPAIRSFFRANRIQPDPTLGAFFNTAFGFRLNRFKLMTNNGLGLNINRTYNQFPINGPALVAQSSIASYNGFWLGYDVVNSRNRRLFINAGYGGMDYGLSIFRRTNQVVPFGTILQRGQTGVVSSLQLRRVGYIDVNLEYTVREKRKRSAGFVTRLGYRRATSAKAYQSDAYRLVDAPKERISQVYLQGTFSFSSNATKAGSIWKQH